MLLLEKRNLTAMTTLLSNGGPLRIDIRSKSERNNNRAMSLVVLCMALCTGQATIVRPCVIRRDGRRSRDRVITGWFYRCDPGGTAERCRRDPAGRGDAGCSGVLPRLPR